MTAPIVGFFVSIVILAITVVLVVTALRRAASSRAAKAPFVNALLDIAGVEKATFAGPVGDEPISSDNEDELNRSDFVSNILRTIRTGPVDRGSFVIAIDGEWGSGKTSILNLVSRRLAATKSGSEVVVTFDPWQLSQTTEIVPQFFITVAAALAAASLEPSQDKPLSSAFRRLGRAYFDVVQSVEPIVRRRAATKFVTQLGAVLGVDYRGPSANDISYFRAVLARLSRMLNVRIVVIIDDIDRLLPREILSVLQVVKSLASFRGIVYLLALDHRVVQVAIERETGFKETRFLEKIIQMPISLPAPSRESLDRLFLSEVLTNETSGDSPADVAQAHSFARIYTEGIRPLIRTPRDARRATLVLRELRARLESEINPVDLVVLAVLQSRYPELFTAIPGFKEALVGPEFLIGDPDAAETEDALGALLDSIPRRDQTAVRALLLTVFPYADMAVRRQRSHTFHSERAAWRRDRRVSDPSHFEIAFSSAGASLVTHANVVRELANLRTEAQVRERVQKIAASPNATAFLSRLQDDIKTLPPDLAALLAEAIVDFGDQFPVGRDSQGLIDNSLRIVWIVADLLKRATDENISDQQRLADILERAEDSLYTPVFVMSVLGIAKNEGNTAADVLPGFEDAATSLARRIEESVRSGALFSTPSVIARSGVLFLLFRLRDWTSQQFVRSLLESALMSDTTFLSFVRSSLVLNATPFSDFRKAAGELIGPGYIARRFSEVLSGAASGMVEYSERERFIEAMSWFAGKAQENESAEIDKQTETDKSDEPVDEL
jgi:hypothetical protein